MMRRLVLITLALLLAMPIAGQAHQAASYYELRWMTLPSSLDGVLDTTTSLDWAFSPTFEDEAKPDAIAATQAWNDHPTQVVFTHLGEVATDPGLGSCPVSSILGDDVNVVRRGEIDGSAFDEGGGILAVAALCAIPLTTTVFHFTVTYDEAEPWHFGPPPIPFDRFDLQGILAHEFGHATGWGRHFQDNTGTECILALRHTMCSSVFPGTADPRDLEPHDIDTWLDAY